MGQTLYLECNSGISGDMTVAALLDLGADENVLRAAINSMPISGFEVEISRVKKAGLDVCDFCVKLDKEHENHDHNMRTNIMVKVIMSIIVIIIIMMKVIMSTAMIMIIMMNIIMNTAMIIIIIMNVIMSITMNMFTAVCYIYKILLIMQI